MKYDYMNRNTSNTKNMIIQVMIKVTVIVYIYIYIYIYIKEYCLKVSHMDTCD